MKIIKSVLLCLVLLSGCVRNTQREVIQPTLMELLVAREPYLAEEIEKKCEELFPQGYEEIIRHYSRLYLDDIYTVSRVVALVRPNGSNEVTAIEYGADNENLVGYKDHDVFFINHEKEEPYAELARKQYPQITEKTDWIVIQKKGIRPEAYNLVFTLTKEQLQDETLLEDIVNLIREEGSFLALRKDEDVESKPDSLMPVLLGMAYGINYCPYEGKLWKHELWLSTDKEAQEYYLEEVNVSALKEKLTDQWESRGQ
ncbi:MAG: hypothetical protein HUJ58_00655 [Erysipelotrichaceae bacterium]|nr:hypothetical protein [Erysipelotrichaceae bacterium]